MDEDICWSISGAPFLFENGMQDLHPSHHYEFFVKSPASSFIERKLNPVELPPNFSKHDEVRNT